MDPDPTPDPTAFLSDFKNANMRIQFRIGIPNTDFFEDENKCLDSGYRRLIPVNP
jgi:hypothetical protein